MVELLRVEEGEPASWPQAPLSLPLSFDARLINAGAIWTRMEHWVGYRWGERSVTWYVSGAGDWTPPLRPYSITQAYRWGGTDYVPVTLAKGPLGLYLVGGQYKVECTVGDTDAPPAAVFEAFRRLAEYMAQNSVDAGLTSVTDGDYSFQRSASTMARAMQYSGAADLLRAYR